VVVVRRVGIARDKFPRGLAFDAGIEVDAIGLAFLELEAHIAGEHLRGQGGLIGFGIKRTAAADDLQIGNHGGGDGGAGFPLVDFRAQGGEGGVGRSLFRGGGGEPGFFGLPVVLDGGDQGGRFAIDRRHAGAVNAERGGITRQFRLEVHEPGDQGIVGGGNIVRHNFTLSFLWLLVIYRGETFHDPVKLRRGTPPFYHPSPDSGKGFWGVKPAKTAIFGVSRWN